MNIVDVGLSPSALSSSVHAPGATRALERARHCLAAFSPAALSSRSSYLNDSPSPLPLNHLAYLARHRPTMAAAGDLPGLVMTYTLTVTSLGGPTSRPLPYVSLSRASIVSAGTIARRFQRAETRSTLLPGSSGFSLFSTVSIRAYSQALIAPFMVELFIAGFLARTPEVVSSGSMRRHMETPHES